MAAPSNTCVLVVEVVGGPADDPTVTGSLEFRHAVDRCLRRVDLAIDANQGVSRASGDHRICASFSRCDDAVLAACEMLERTSNLPPLRGKRFMIRVGIHYGSDDRDHGEQTQTLAQRLSTAAHGGEALASDAVVFQLSPGTRHYAKPENTKQRSLAGFEGQVFIVSRQAQVVASLPPASRLTRRLRIRHRGNTMLVDDARPVLLFGRELGNDVVIIDPRASRQHARIERRREGFFIIDRSTNGTFVNFQNGQEHCLKGTETLLTGSGQIGCGFAIADGGRDLVSFDIG